MFSHGTDRHLERMQKKIDKCVAEQAKAVQLAHDLQHQNELERARLRMTLVKDEMEIAEEEDQAFRARQRWVVVVDGSEPCPVRAEMELDSQLRPPPLQSTGAWPYNRPCAHQYVGKSQSCMVISGRLIVHAPVQRRSSSLLRAR